MTRDEPIVDLPLFGNRGFAVSWLLMFALGFVLFGTTQLLPQMVQEVLGYTATWAGLVITPGGFAVMALMPLVGFLLKKIQARSLIAVGLIIEALSLFHMSALSPLVAFRDVAWDRVFQAAGIAFLFVPISTIAYLGLPPGKNNSASALINLARKLGGSFGISLAQTWLARRSQFHQTNLVSHLTPYDPTYRQALERMQHVFPRWKANGPGRHLSRRAAAGLDDVVHRHLLSVGLDLPGPGADRLLPGQDQARRNARGPLTRKKGTGVIK